MFPTKSSHGVFMGNLIVTDKTNDTEEIWFSSCLCLYDFNILLVIIHISMNQNYEESTELSYLVSNLVTDNMGLFCACFVAIMYLISFHADIFALRSMSFMMYYFQYLKGILEKILKWIKWKFIDTVVLLNSCAGTQRKWNLYDV